jgi:hypothetical protein
MKKWQKFLIWFACCIAFVLACDLTDYFVEQNLLSFWYVALIEGMFVLLGATGAYIDIWLRKQNKTNSKAKKRI